MRIEITALGLNNIIKNKYGIRLVTCGECGKAFSNYDGKEKEGQTEEGWEHTYTCPFCGFTEDICHFPDLFT